MVDRQQNFLKAVSTIPNYQGWESNAIISNINDVFNSGDKERINKLVGSLENIDAYKGWSVDEIHNNISELFPSKLQEQIQVEIEPLKPIKPEYERLAETFPTEALSTKTIQQQAEIKPKPPNRVSRILAGIGVGYEEPEIYSRTLERKEKLGDLRRRIEQTESDYKVSEETIKQANKLTNKIKEFESLISGNKFIGTEEQYVDYQRRFNDYNNFVSENQDKLNLVSQETTSQYKKDIQEYNRLASEESKQLRFREPVISRPEYPEVIEKAISVEEEPLKEYRTEEEIPIPKRLEVPEEQLRVPEFKIDELITIPVETVSTYAKVNIPEEEKEKSLSTEEAARLSNVLSIAKEYDISPYYVDENYRNLIKQIGKETGLKQIPTTSEVIGAALILPVTAGIIANPVTVGLGIAQFLVLSEIENAVVSKIIGKPYKPLAGKGIADLLPKETSLKTYEFVELLDFIGKAAIVGGIKKLSPKLNTKFTKDIIKTYKLPKKVYVSPEKVASTFRTGKEISPEELDLLKSLNLKSYQWKKAIRKGITIETPSETIIKISDKPYWAKIKSAFKIKPTLVTKYEETPLKYEYGKAGKKTKVFKKKGVPKLLTELKPITPKDIQTVDVNKNPKTGKYLIKVTSKEGQIVNSKEINTFKEAQSIATGLSKEVAKAQKYARVEKVELPEVPVAPTEKPIAGVSSKSKMEVPEVMKQIKKGDYIPVSNKSEYAGQEMKWTEEMKSPSFAKEDMFLYHSSHFLPNQIKAFYPKLTAFYVHTRSPGNVYELFVPKGTPIIESTTGEEIRVQLEENMKLRYLGEVELKRAKDFTTLHPFYEKIDKTIKGKEVEPTKVPVAEKQPWEMTVKNFDKKYTTLKEKLEKDIITENEYKEYQRLENEVKLKPSEVLPASEATVQLRKQGLINSDLHYNSVKKALSKDKTVPTEVLKDYPELVKPTEKVEPAIPKKPSVTRITGKTRIPSKALEGKGFVALKSIFGTKVARESESGAIVKDYDQIEGVTIGGKSILNVESKSTDYDTKAVDNYEELTGKKLSFDEILEEANNEIARFEAGEIGKTGKILAEKPATKELFEAEELATKEEKGIEEIITEVGGLNPIISKSGKTVKFEVPKIDIKTTMRVKELNYDDVAERIDKRLREHEIPEEKLELLNKKSKLRQRIHAFVGIKGIPKTELQKIVKKQTGHLHTTHKDISVEQLEKILKSVKRIRPKTIDHKTVIKPKTEKRIRELKERFVKEDYITEKTYQDILKRMNIREPFYVNKNQFITNKQGLELIRSLLRKTPTIREFYGKEILDIPDRTIRNWREYGLKDPELIRDSKRKVFKRKIKEKETLLTRFLRNFSSVERYAEIIQRKTDKNVYDLTENLSRNQGYFELALEKEMQKMPKEYLVLNIEERELITNWLAGEDISLSDRALKVAKAIKEYYNSNMAQTLLKVNRFQQWLENPARISIKGVPEKRLNELKTTWEEEGNLALIEEIHTTKGFTIEKNYKPDITLSNSFPLYSAPGVGKGLLQSKLGKGIEAEKDALIAFERKLRSDFKILYLNDAIKEMTELLYKEDLPNYIKGDIRTLLINHSIGLQQSSLEKVLEWGISQIIKTALSNPLKWARNFPQRLMILPYTPPHLMPKVFLQVMRRSLLRGSIRVNKGKAWKKTPEAKKNSFLAHTTEEGALEHEFMGMKRHKILAKLGWLGEVCKKYITVYGGVDTSSRWSIFDPVSINIMRAFEQGKPFRKMKGVLYWEHIPTELKNILRAEIDNKNYEYVALRIAEHMAATKTQWRYGRHEKSIHEQTSGGHLLLRVTTYGRSTIHTYVDDAKTCSEGILNGDKSKFYKGFQAVVLRTALMYAIAKAFFRVFGKKKKYGYGWNPLEVLDVEAAGLIDAVTDLWSGIKDPAFMMTKQLLNKHILGTITDEELDKIINSESKKLLKGIDTIPYRTVIGYRQILWMLESVYGVEKIKPLSDTYNKVVHDKGWEEKEIERNAWQTLRHSIFGTDTEKETAKKPAEHEPIEY